MNLFRAPRSRVCQILYFQLQGDVDLFLFRFRVFEQRVRLIDYYYEAAQNPDAMTESEVV